MIMLFNLVDALYHLLRTVFELREFRRLAIEED